MHIGDKVAIDAGNGDADRTNFFCRVKHGNLDAMLNIVTNTRVNIERILLKIICRQ